MLHISHAATSGIKSVLVYSTDYDVFASLIYHFKVSFDLHELYVLVGGLKRTQRTVPIHILVKTLNPLLSECMPAIHALTGCDTTSKVGTKTAILKKSMNLELVSYFGKSE